MLPNHKFISNLSFDDDSTLNLLGTSDNLDKAKQALNSFCFASGLQVNWVKTHVIWAFPRPRTFDRGAQMGLHWIPISGHAIHLIIPVGFQLSQQTQDKAALAHISSKLVFWGGQRLS